VSFPQTAVHTLSVISEAVTMSGGPETAFWFRSCIA